MRCPPRLRRGDRPPAGHSELGPVPSLEGSPLTTLDTLLEEIRTGPSGPQIAAFFDFDGTLIDAAPVVRRLGVENMLCTELETEDSILTGRLAVRRLLGPASIAAAQSFAACHGSALAASHGYATGVEGVPFLRAVGHPHPV